MGQSGDELSWLSGEAPILLVGYEAAVRPARKPKRVGFI